MQNQDGVVSIKADRFSALDGTPPPSTSRTTFTDLGENPEQAVTRQPGISRSDRVHPVIYSNRLGAARRGSHEWRGPTAKRAHAKLAKAPTGIQGLDEITGGGLPRGRPTLVCGGAGCGKTLLAMEFLVRGATEYGEPGVFMAFEETAEELAAERRARSASTSTSWSRSKKLVVDHVHVERSEIEETGEYDLEGLFIRLGLRHRLDRRQAGRARHHRDAVRRAVRTQAILRAELRRLFRWLKDKGVTAVITGERGDGHADPPRPGGVRLRLRDPARPPGRRPGLDAAAARRQVPRHRRTAPTSTRSSSTRTASPSCRSPRSGCEHEASDERVSTGVPRLDAMLGGEGYYRGSSVLVSGTAGHRQDAASPRHFADAACRRGERCLYFAFEESQSQIVRNMRSIGIDLRAVGRRRACCGSTPRGPTLLRPGDAPGRACTSWSSEFEPRVVVVDPITNLARRGHAAARPTAMLTAADRLPEDAADHRPCSPA